MPAPSTARKRTSVWPSAETEAERRTARPTRSFRRRSTSGTRSRLSEEPPASVEPARRQRQRCDVLPCRRSAGHGRGGRRRAVEPHRRLHPVRGQARRCRRARNRTSVWPWADTVAPRAGGRAPTRSCRRRSRSGTRSPASPDPASAEPLAVTVDEACDSQVSEPPVTRRVGRGAAIDAGGALHPGRRCCRRRQPRGSGRSVSPSAETTADAPACRRRPGRAAVGRRLVLDVVQAGAAASVEPDAESVTRGDVLPRRPSRR